MLIFFWFLAFVGVALIYPIPYIGEKLNFPQNANAALKLFGIVLAVIALLVLNKIGGFN